MESERLPGSEGDATQDFVMVNGPAFNAPNAGKLLGGRKLLAATTDKAEGLKKVVSGALQAAEAAVEAFGGKSTKLVSMGGQIETNILGETFYTQVPLLWGPYTAKVSVAPVSPDLMALTDVPLNLDGKPNGIRAPGGLRDVAAVPHAAQQAGDQGAADAGRRAGLSRIRAQPRTITGCVDPRPGLSYRHAP